MLQVTEKKAEGKLKSGKSTSDNVKETVFCVLLRAIFIADNVSLQLVAKGSATNDTKKVGMLVALEKSSTASTSGSATRPPIQVPTNNIITALKEVHLGESTDFSL